MDSDQALNFAYNPRLLVADHLDVMARWRIKSAQARQDSICQLDIPYGSSAFETLDIFPAKERHAPTLLFIHGGYWRGSDKSEYSFIGKAWQDAGITAVLLNYALVPKVSLSTIIEQITNAIIWVYQHIEEYSGNKKSLFLSGHSAGGYLATKMMMTPWQELLELNDQNLLQACFTMSGLYDLEPLTRASFIAADLGLTSSQAQSLSVINPSNPKNTLSKNATVYAAIGNDEGQGFHDQQNLLKRYWPDALARSFILQNCNHFTIMDELGDKDSLLFQAVLQMIDSQLKNQIKNRSGSLDSC